MPGHARPGDEGEERSEGEQPAQCQSPGVPVQAPTHDENGCDARQKRRFPAGGSERSEWNSPRYRPTREQGRCCERNPQFLIERRPDRQDRDESRGEEGGDGNLTSHEESTLQEARSRDRG